MMSIDPVVAFFLLGLLGGRMGSDLKLSSGLYDTLTIYLLLAIGLKLAQSSVGALVIPVLVVVAASAVTPVLAYQVLRRGGKLAHPDAASISAHYGSVSVVTYGHFYKSPDPVTLRTCKRAYLTLRTVTPV